MSYRCVLVKEFKSGDIFSRRGSSYKQSTDTVTWGGGEVGPGLARRVPSRILPTLSICSA